MRPLHQQVENLGKEVTSQMNEKGDTVWKSIEFTLRNLHSRKKLNYSMLKWIEQMLSKLFLLFNVSKILVFSTLWGGKRRILLWRKRVMMTTILVEERWVGVLGCFKLHENFHTRKKNNQCYQLKLGFVSFAISLKRD